MRFFNGQGKTTTPSMEGATPPVSNSAHDEYGVPTTGRGDASGGFTSRFLGGLGRDRHRPPRSHGGDRPGGDAGGDDAGGLEYTSSYASMADIEGSERRERGLTEGVTSNDDARRDEYYEISSENVNEEEEEEGGGELEYVAPDEAAMEDDTKSGDQRQKRTRAAAKSIKRVVSSVLPKVEILPWTTFFCLSLWCTIP